MATGYGPNGTLTAAEFERGKAAAIAKVEAARGEELAEADRHRAQAEKLEAERAAASTVADDERLEKAIAVHGRAEAVARRNAERLGQEREAAQADLADARGKIAADRSCALSRSRVDLRRRMQMSATATATAAFEKALADDVAGLAEWQTITGRTGEFPVGYADDPPDAEDLERRLKLLASPRRAPGEDASRRARTAAENRERDREREIERLVHQGELVLFSDELTAGTPRDVLEEARARLRARKAEAFAGREKVAVRERIDAWREGE